jgi:outer membrane protein assembly factor BamB
MYNDHHVQMKKKNLTIIFTVLALSVLLAGCVGEIGAASSWPGLTVSEDVAFLAYNRHVYAVNTDTGTQLWRFPPEPDNRISFYAPPVLTDDNQLLVGGYNNILYSLNPQTGQVNWEFTESRNRFIASPLASSESIFAPDAENNMYALNISGQRQWTFRTTGPTWAQPVTSQDCNCIFLPSMDQHLYALQKTDGNLLWKSESMDGALVGTPALSEDGVLYVGTFARKMAAIDADDGQTLWSSDVQGWVWSGPALAGDRLFFGDLDGNLYAMNSTNGQIVWHLTPDRLDGPIVGTPLVVEDTIYVPTESGTLYAISTDGTTRWRRDLSGSLYTSPALAGDLILVSPIRTDALLVALDLNGDPAWRFIPGN